MLETDAENFNYNTSASGVGKISKAALDVGAVGNWKFYDSTTIANVTYTDNRIGLDNITISGSANYDNKNYGYGKNVSVTDIQVSGIDAGNYTWNSTTQTTSNIEKYGINAVATAQDKVYDGNVRTSVDLDYDVFAGDDVTVTGTAFFNDKNVGSNKSFFVGWVGLTGEDSQNYYLADTYGTAGITKAALSISAEANSKTYDGNTSASIGLNDDRVEGDNLVIGYAGADFEDKNAGQGKVINVNGLSVSGADAQNYTWDSSITTSADIDKATLVLGASGVNKTYNGNTDADVNFNDNRILGDDLSISVTASFDDKNAGVGKVVTLDDIVITGADAQNYDVLAPASVTADIAKATLTVSASGVDKTYNGSTDADVALSDDRVTSDDLTFGYSAAFTDKNAGAGKIVNVDSLVVSGADAQNYDVVAQTTTTATINKANLHISANGIDKIYDGSTAVLVGLNDDRILGDDLNVNFADASFSDKNAGTGKLVTASGITLSGADAGNYIANDTATTTANIAKANLAIGATGVDRVYNGTTGADVVLNDDRILGDDIAISYNANFSDKNAGYGKVVSATDLVVTGTDAGNYVWNTTAAATANITKANINPTAHATDKVYDGNVRTSVDLDYNVFGDDDLSITGTAFFYDKNAGDNKSFFVGWMNITGADKDNYIVSNIYGTASITKAALGIMADASGKVYDGSATALVGLSDGRVSGDDLQITYGSANFDDKNAGYNKTVSVNGINVSGSDAQNYTWDSSVMSTADIGKATLDLSASGVSKTYNGNTKADVTITDDRIAGDDLSITYNASFADKNAGSGKLVTLDDIVITGADSQNYDVVSTASTTADIFKASLNVGATGIDRVYDGSTAATVILSDDRITGDDLVISGSSSFNDKNAGAGKLVTVDGITLSGADANNYSWNTFTTTSADIAKANLNISAAGVDRVYDGSTGASVTLSDDRIAGDDLNFNYVASFSDKNAGTGKLVTATGINATGADAQNYEWSNTATTTADIAKAALDISAVASGKTYDGNTNASVTLSDDRVSGDDLVINASSSFSDKNAGAGKTVTVDGITLAGADANNYTFNTQTTTTADIDKASLNISASGKDRVYDGSTKADVVLTDNRVVGDDLAIDYTASFSDKNAGSNKNVTAGLSVTGDDANNYTWNETATTTADIAKANLQISAAASGKTYDGKTDASVVLSDDRIAGDDLTIGGSGTFSDKNAGNGKVVTVNGITLAGADADNYTFNTQASTTADISKANLNISAMADSKVYDGSTSATVNLQDDRLAGDDLVINGDAHFADKNAGNGKTVTVGSITLGGEDAGNYNFNTSTTANADIAKADLIVKAGNASKVEGALDGVLNWSLNGGTLFGDDAITGSLGREAGETAGHYAINKGDLSAGGNYDLSIVPGDFEITSRKPVVKPELEHTKEIVASISTATKVKTESVALDTSTGSASGTPGDYRLLNLGMKLPDDITTDESTSY